MIEGVVIHGEGIGKTLGYPTANLDKQIDTISLQNGVYAAKTKIGPHMYDSALIIIKERGKCEVHILNFDGDLYGKQLAVDPIERVSAIERFDSTKELIEKMGRDIAAVTACLQKEQ